MLAKLIHGDIGLYSEIHEETKKATLKQLFKIKSDLKKHKLTIFQEELALIKQIRNATQKILELLKSEEKKLYECILKVQSLKVIDNSKEATFIESMLKVPPTNLSKIQSIQSPNLHINQINSECIKNLFILDELSEENILIDMNYTNDAYNLKFIELSNLSLYIFNSETISIDKIKLPYESSFEPYGASCLLPDGSLFYKRTSSSMIIDSEGSIKILPEYQGKTFSSCAVYKDGDIYLFGASRNSSAKFDIGQNRWILLTELPISIGGHRSAFIFKHYIILGSSNMNQIFYYDTIIDSFGEIISLNLSFDAQKVFFVVNEKLYFADFASMKYRITENLVTWTEQEDRTFSSYNSKPIISSPILYNKKYYFANFSNILTFDLKTKKIENVMEYRDNRLIKF